MNKSKMIDFALIVFLVFLIFAFYLVIGDQIKEERIARKTLKIASYESVFSDKLVENFEAEYDVDVKFYFFEDDYDVLSDLENGISYDLVLVSDEIILELIESDFLVKLDKRMLSNRFLVSEKFKGRDYDENLDYSFPFDWGTTGIIYNKNYFSENIDIDIFWNDEYKNRVSLVKDSGEIIYISSLYSEIKGFPKTRNERLRVEKSIEDLEENIDGFFPCYELNEKMLDREIVAALQYSYAAIALISENDDFEYIIPESAGTAWVDLFAIPKGSKNREYAYKFIDFFNYPENNLLNFKEINSFSANNECVKKMNPEFSSFEYFNYSYLEELVMFSSIPKSSEYFYLVYGLNQKFLEDEGNE